jgi:ABC-2 type transport system permease protein
MNLFLRELRFNLKSLITWSVSIMLFILIGMGKYAAMGSTDGSLTEMINNMPKSIQAIMGGGAFDLNTVLGFYAVVYLYLILMASVHALMIGATILSKEERDHTTEFLMVKPITRNQVITSKGLAGFVQLAIINLVTLFGSISILKAYSDDRITKEIIILMIGMFFIQVIFSSIGFAISAYSHHHKQASLVGTGILLILFLISLVVDMMESLSWLKYLTPFQYFSAKTLLIETGFNPILVLFSLFLVTALIASAYHTYNKRDLNH